jgi:hypothetical protein
LNQLDVGSSYATCFTSGEALVEDMWVRSSDHVATTPRHPGPLQIRASRIRIWHWDGGRLSLCLSDMRRPSAARTRRKIRAPGIEIRLGDFVVDYLPVLILNDEISVLLAGDLACRLCSGVSCLGERISVFFANSADQLEHVVSYSA